MRFMSNAKKNYRVYILLLMLCYRSAIQSNLMYIFLQYLYVLIDDGFYGGYFLNLDIVLLVMQPVLCFVHFQVDVKKATPKQEQGWYGRGRGRGGQHLNRCMIPFFIMVVL